MTHKRKHLILAVLILPVSAWLLYAGLVRFFGEPVKADALVGRSEGQIRWSYGSPDEVMEGYQVFAMEFPKSLPPGPIRTLIFYPGGLLHPEGGRLWVWIVEQNGEWFCFKSIWCADGVQF